MQLIGVMTWVKTLLKIITHTIKDPCELVWKCNNQGYEYFFGVCVEMDIPKMVTGHSGDSNSHIQWILAPETCAFTYSTTKASLVNC